uniref:Uncharacterized protein n=1 Tax=Parascaris equorum TaxID=6256 RepID=A0A914RD50_PAREQ
MQNGIFVVLQRLLSNCVHPEGWHTYSLFSRMLRLSQPLMRVSSFHQPNVS